MMLKSYYLILLLTVTVFSQNRMVTSVNWQGNKRMNLKFLAAFIETKVGLPLDSLKVENDVAALTRLNGISNVTFAISPIDQEECAVTFKVIENYSILPNVELWTTDAAAAAYRLGLYDYNFLGKNNSIGGFYQYNGVSSYGISFSAPFLFSSNLGIETNFRKISSIEPIFINKIPSQYQYSNKGIDFSVVYRLNFRNSFKLGFTVFNEKYEYISGEQSPEVPQFFEIDKASVKSTYDFNNLKYDFYLVKGFKNQLFSQVVINDNKLQDKFVVFRNDLLFFSRIGKNGNWGTRLQLGLSTNSNSPFAPFALDNNMNIRGVGNIVDRGTGVIVINTEYRKTLYEKKWFVLQGNAFIDSGTWRNPGGSFTDFITNENIKVYPGVGLRIIHKAIFNAVFRIDYGYGITKNANNGIVFGVGQYF
ncbi:outer membrane protein assembly factor [Flavobacterium ovatum]|uniref:outer membrane protein assembly factor n=1 Tax=Flavobacterium ovatum TaxID=1928857 RepID=UPI00344E2F56